MKLHLPISAVAMMLAAGSASAITITNDFSQLGTVYQTSTGAFSTTNAAGSTDVTANFRADANFAASILDSAVKAPFDLSINITLYDLSFEGAVSDSSISAYGPNGLPSQSAIRVDNGGMKFFVDATPSNNSEFAIKSRDASLGGGMVNVARIGNGISGFASSNYDLVTLFVHEMEHSIAYNSAIPSYSDKAGTSARSGFDIPTSLTGFKSSFFLPLIPDGGSHIDGNVDNGLFNGTVVADPSFVSGQRALLTGAEIYGACYVDGCTLSQVNTNPYAASRVPEPAAYGIMLFGLGTIGLRLSRKNRR